MKNRYNIYAIILMLCLLGISSCIKEFPNDSAPKSEGSVFINMEIFNNTTTTKSDTYALQNGVLGGSEYIIDDLRIYVFNSDGSLDKMVYATSLAADHIVQQKIQVPKDTSKELYFIANEPAALTSKLEDITSASELEDIEFTIAEAMNKGFNGAATFSESDFLIPMTATYSLRNAMSDVNIYVGLTRAVARIDLYLDKGASAASRNIDLDASTKFTVDGLTYTSSLLVSNVGAPQNIKNGLEVTSSDISLNAVTSDRTSAQRVLSCYFAERTYDYADPTSKITIKIDGMKENGVDVGTKSVTLGDAGTLSQINRNYIYKIYGSYNGTEIVADHFTIVDWTDVEVDGEIEGVMIAVDGEVAMDWILNGNSFTSKTISFGSNKPISFYLPVSLDVDDDNIPNLDFKLFEFPDMSAGQSYDLKTIDLANNYIYAAKWIKSATIHFTSPQSGYFKFTYGPTKVNYKIQSYPVRIKSDNVTTQMKAVYDNGYIPVERLSDHWKLRAPGGVVFSKRGEAKHPLSTPEVLYRDDDGYYRGEYATTADKASKYCKNTFGPDWYVPSYADMVELASMYDMLGVSYRFQNNGSAEGSGELTEARYWSSSVRDSNYWSGDFMSRSYMIDDLMELRDGSNSYFVRCIMDLK